MKPPKRMGRFVLTSELLDDEQLARAIYRDMIVYKVDHDVARGLVEIWAVHPDFNEVQATFAIFTYTATVLKDDSGEYTITWKS